MKFTISAAAKLYDKHRSTLHRHIKKGQLSCDFQRDGSPRLDLSELIRIYGEPKNLPEVLRQDATAGVAGSATHDATDSDTALIDEIRRQTAVIERMAERIERLEQALLQLPTPTPAKQEKPAGKRHDFSDLLDKLKQDTENE